MKLNEAIAKRVSGILEKENITAYELAKRGGMAKQDIYAIVDCEYKKVSVYMIYQIAATVNMSLTEFFNDPVFADIED